MGGKNFSAAPRRRRAKDVVRAAALALAALALPLSGQAAAATLVAPAGTDLTVPAGVAVTTDGSVWVSDSHNGVCRLRMDPSPALVRDAYCGAEGDPGLEESRPTGTGQLAFDATTSNLYVAEGTSHSSGVWRLHWDSTTNRIDAAAKIYSDSADNRVFGLALAPNGDLDFSSKRDTVIRRLLAPASGPAPAVQVVGFSQDEGAASLAHLGQKLYLADGGGLTEIAAPGPLGGTAVTVPGLPSGTTPSALAADPANGVLFLGTNNASLIDPVLSLTADGTVATYEDGFTFVTALGHAADGTLYAADDPPAGAGAVGTDGQSRVWRLPPGPLNAPRVTITSAPPPAGPSGEVSFAFQSRAGTTFECEFRGSGFQPCGSGPQGEFGPGGSLAEGVYEFSVRARDANGTGKATKWAFEVDQTAPWVTIDSTQHEAVGGTIAIRFSAGELNIAYSCRLDGGAWAPCSSPQRYTALPLGDHLFEVRGTDLAGNTGAVLEFALRSLPAPPAAAASRPAPAGPSDSPDATGATGVDVPSTDRLPRMDLSVPCTSVASPQPSALFRLGGRGPALARFVAPAGARYAKFTLRRAASRRRAVIVETLAYARVRRIGAEHSTRLHLTGGQRRKLRGGRFRLAVAYGTCRTRVGDWRWLKPMTTTGGSHR